MSFESIRKIDLYESEKLALKEILVVYLSTDKNKKFTFDDIEFVDSLPGKSYIESLSKTIDLNSIKDILPKNLLSRDNNNNILLNVDYKNKLISIVVDLKVEINKQLDKISNELINKIKSTIKNVSIDNIEKFKQKNVCFTNDDLSKRAKYYSKYFDNLIVGEIKFDKLENELGKCTTNLIYNKDGFDALPKCIVKGKPIQYDNGAYAYCVITINSYAMGLNVDETIVHELCHAYCSTNGVLCGHEGLFTKISDKLNKQCGLHINTTSTKNLFEDELFISVMYSKKCEQILRTIKQKDLNDFICKILTNVADKNKSHSKFYNDLLYCIKMIDYKKDEKIKDCYRQTVSDIYDMWLDIFGNSNKNINAFKLILAFAGYNISDSDRRIILNNRRFITRYIDDILN